ncbi:MAG: sigma-70 family RNA polymerase sigma factor [Planctomycetota bacterium]
MKDTRDSDLVARVATGDEGAFDELYRRHHRWVHGLARRLGGDGECADDVLQETFGWLAMRAPALDLRVPMRSLLDPVVRHGVLTWKRRNRREGALEAPEDRPGDLSEPADDLADLAEILRSLGEEHREVVLLRHLDGLELSEIAAALGVPLGRSSPAPPRARPDPGAPARPPLLRGAGDLNPPPSGRNARLS